MNKVIDATLVGDKIVLREEHEGFLEITYKIKVIMLGRGDHDRLLKSMTHTSVVRSQSDFKYNEIIATLGGPSHLSTPLLDSQKECPLCNSPMKLRHGKFGPFYGCSAYPECKAVVNMKGKMSKPTMETLKRQTLRKDSKQVDSLDYRLRDIDLG